MASSRPRIEPRGATSACHSSCTPEQVATPTNHCVPIECISSFVTCEKLHRRSNAPGSRLNSLQLKPHLHAGEGAAQHQVIEIAEMSDSEEFALGFSEPLAEGHIEAVENHGSELCLIMSGRHQDRGQGTGVLAGIYRVELQAPGSDGDSRGLGVPRVPGKDVVQPLFLEHPE